MDNVPKAVFNALCSMDPTFQTMAEYAALQDEEAELKAEIYACSNSKLARFVC